MIDANNKNRHERLPSYDFEHILCLNSRKKQRIFILLKNIVGIGIFFLLIALAGCATSSRPTPLRPSSWVARVKTLTHLKNWQINGKIAVQTARDSGSASVIWIQRANNYSIT